MTYEEYNKEQLLSLKEELDGAYKDFKAYNLKLDMSRGKPSFAQLDLSIGLLDVINSTSCFLSSCGDDCRNYGNLGGIPEARKFMAELVNIDPKYVMIHGVSSLNIMYDIISYSFIHGVSGSTPWCKLDKVKFLCPVPGYDRHFAITKAFGVDMINIPMDSNGPDMDLIEKLVKEDASIKGIWCVPEYSNPGGIVYSDEVVRRFGALKPAAEDFRIFWDNSYCVHHLYFDDYREIPDILGECERYGNPHMVYEFLSTSKISFPGAGISAIATSEVNQQAFKKYMSNQIICHDKINQLRHVRYFKDKNTLLKHMKKHTELLRPKFEAVTHILDEELAGLNIGTWNNPRGGYFISFYAMEGCAKSIVAKCKAAGVTLTNAGATYPYGIDPSDSNIRLAPSYPDLKELITAAKIFALCVKIVSIEKLLEKYA